MDRDERETTVNDTPAPSTGYIDTRLLSLIESNTKWTVVILGSCAIGIFMIDANLTRIFRALRQLRT